jgi:serine/threonine protein kinase, bacterial
MSESAGRRPLFDRLGLRGRIAIAAGVVVFIAIVAAALAYLSDGWPRNVVAATPSASSANSGSPQIELPFGRDLVNPLAVAVDAAGDVYVGDTDEKDRHVLKLVPGSKTPTKLSLGRDDPDGVVPVAIAVDAAGALYVADYGDGRVLKLAAGSTRQTVLPFTFPGLFDPVAVAVDNAGGVYVGDIDLNDNDTQAARVLKLAAGSTVQTTLLKPSEVCDSGVAADTSGNVYVATDNGVLKLTPGSPTPTKLPFTDLNLDPCAGGLAVDTAGNVYVADADNNRVLKLAKDAKGLSAPTVLPFTGLDQPLAVAVDTAGAVYVVDYGNDRVLKLPPR